MVNRNTICRSKDQGGLGGEELNSDEPIFICDMGMKILAKIDEPMVAPSDTSLLLEEVGYEIQEEYQGIITTLERYL